MRSLRQGMAGTTTKLGTCCLLLLAAAAMASARSLPGGSTAGLQEATTSTASPHRRKLNSLSTYSRVMVSDKELCALVRPKEGAPPPSLLLAADPGDTTGVPEIAQQPVLHRP